MDLAVSVDLDVTLVDLRLAALEQRLLELRSVLVAFSGGADSALLLAAAVRALGRDRVGAATAVSPSLARSERAAAAELARSLGVGHVELVTEELSRAGYVANGTDRCFHCKATLLDTLRPVADRLGLAHVRRARMPTTPLPASGRASGPRPTAELPHRCSTPG